MCNIASELGGRKERTALSEVFPPSSPLSSTKSAVKITKVTFCGWKKGNFSFPW